MMPKTLSRFNRLFLFCSIASTFTLPTDHSKASPGETPEWEFASTGASSIEARPKNSSGLNVLVGSSSVGVNFEFAYQKVTPRIVNGREVYESKLEPCVKLVTLHFSSPQSINSLLGQVVLQGPFNMKRALVLDSVADDWRTFRLKTDQSLVCLRSGLNKLVVKRGIVDLNGRRSQRDLENIIPFPPERNLNELHSSFHSTQYVGQEKIKKQSDITITFSDAPPVATEYQSSEYASEHASEYGRKNVSGADSLKSTSWGRVNGARVNEAIAVLDRWTSYEKINPLYKNSRSNSLALLPIDDLLNQYAEVNRKHHYGNADTIYVLRRAAKFTKTLFPDLQFVPIADLSRPDGKTPFIEFGSERLYLHPEGSHQNGRDVDVSYITTGGGNDPKAPIDFERNFWFLYAVLQSTGVDLVMTAYREEFLTMANQAYQKGLINKFALGRFEMLMQDEGLNHDKHFHISVSNDVNLGKSRKFTKSDDVYSCYLGLRPNFRGGNYNYCSSL